MKDKAAINRSDRFINIEASAFKRVGVILRLASIGVALLAIILAIALPTVIVEYATYSNGTVFSPARSDAFPTQYISGVNAFFGGGYFAYYLKAYKTRPELLIGRQCQFNYIMLLIFILALAACVLAFLVTFSKKMEKVSKLVTVIFVIAGILVICSPLWFMMVYGFGNEGQYSSSDYTHYFTYDSLYTHCAYGSIVSGLVFVVAAALFGVGTNREMAGGERGSKE